MIHKDGKKAQISISFFSSNDAYSFYVNKHLNLDIVNTY